MEWAINAEGGVIRYAYDNNGRVISQTQFPSVKSTTTTPTAADMNSWASQQSVAPGSVNIRTTRFFYDEAWQIIFEIDAEGLLTEYSYDKVGHKTSETRHAVSLWPAANATTAQVRASFTYNSATARSTTFYYDPSGRLIIATMLQVLPQTIFITLLTN